MVGTILTGVVLPLCMPSRNAVLPLLVAQHRITNAVSLSMGGQNLTRIIGPSIAGLLIAPLGLGVVWGLIVVLEVVAILSVLPLPRHGMRSTHASHGFVTDLTAGFQYIGASRLMALLVFSAMVMPLFGFPIQQALPVFAEDVFDRGPDALGFLMAAAGVGGFSGAVLATALDVLRHKGRILLAGALLMSGSYLAFAFAPTFEWALALLALGNLGAMLFQTTNQSIVQAITSDEMRGRVWAVLMMSFGVTPLGILPLTIAIDEIGAPAAVAGSAVIMLAILISLFTLSPRLRTLSMDSLEQAELSPAEAARLVAEGQITPEEAQRLTGRA
jgi:MFS family permease